MPLHSKISLVRETLGIKAVTDWCKFTPADVVAIDGIGPATLDEIRLYLAGRRLTLKNDQTFDFWWKSLGSSAMGTQMSDAERSAPASFGIVIDGRERIPYRFAGFTKTTTDGEIVSLIVNVEYGRLETGDYALSGYESLAAVERKTLADLYSTLGQDRDRFEREHERLAQMKSACVVIEADWHTVMNCPPPESKLNPKSVLGTSIAWYQRYGIAWFMMPGTRAAELFTYRFLEMFYRQQTKPRKD